MGIGTSAPQQPLHLSSADPRLQIQRTGTGAGIWQARVDNVGKFVIGDVSNSTEPIRIEAGSPTGSIHIESTGYVGIGTLDPQSELAVNGTITAKEVTVTSEGWADHVFDPDYPLRPLTDLDAYVRDNRHLPGIPATIDIKDQGINLGQLQSILLEKIEELTLYLIELKHENEDLRIRIDTLEEDEK